MPQSSADENDSETFWTRFFHDQPIEWSEAGSAPDGASWSVGGVTLLRGTAPAFRLDRTADEVRRLPLDQFSISVLTQGRSSVAAQGRIQGYAAGDLLMIDESEPYSIDAEATGFIAALVPRSLIVERRPEIRMQCVTATRAGSGVAAALGGLIAALVHRGPAMEAEAEPWIREALVALVVGAVETQGVRQGRLPQDSPLHGRVRAFVMANLAIPDLSPDQIAAGVGASRSTLYRAFAADGGVARYVQNCRIDAVRRRLLDPAETRSIGELAFAVGFASVGHFSRVFRERTGLSPREFRADPRKPSTPDP